MLAPFSIACFISFKSPSLDASKRSFSICLILIVYKWRQCKFITVKYWCLMLQHCSAATNHQKSKTVHVSHKERAETIAAGKISW
jgi:hypothetical protein